MDDLILKLKEDIIEQLNLEDLTVEDIGTEEPLFGDEIGLDSIDALELIVYLEKNHGVKIENPEEGRKVFNSVKTMAEFIEENK
ncbi:phosphopantetheine-binding protein [Mangrovivirga sp. M17]|uniref:Phosphopantetheine-binding protein n=1 Tax=Mangrovivirga halotolerans TaxID=2993936 RepID=A0ABT3RUA9_9BACT|nr:phosphopantetheine-binding protein [Mangrovivirga halotolerans]MCX2745367.1 phosphopantetheine-binding protein [Mangrovivirga halotolerans]